MKINILIIDGNEKESSDILKNNNMETQYEQEISTSCLYFIFAGLFST